MAGRAGGRRRRDMRTDKGKAGDAVIERSCRPTCRRMTSRTVRRGKSGAGCRVDGIVRLLPGSQMALRIAAIGGGNRQIVIVIDVAE